MIMRGIAAGAVLLALGQEATAGEKPNILRRMSCTVVRYYVAKYSASAAESWARSHGATDAEVESARHCLTNGGVQTAVAK
jgi:hypothetical protein